VTSSSIRSRNHDDGGFSKSSNETIDSDAVEGVVFVPVLDAMLEEMVGCVEVEARGCVDVEAAREEGFLAEVHFEHVVLLAMLHVFVSQTYA
jgi:hypothetical protein